MQFIPTRSLPPMSQYKRLIAAALPGASVTNARSLLGAGARVEVRLHGVRVTVSLDHAQVRGELCATTSVTIASSACGAALRSMRVSDALATLIDAHGETAELTIDADGVTLRWAGWPSSAALLRAITAAAAEGATPSPWRAAA